MKGQRLAAFGLVLLFGFVAPCAAVVYVDCDAPGPGHDGLTWDTAYLTIQEGVNLATPNGEIWVADGTYVENVLMGQGVQLYGGFLGAEPGGYETEREQRDWVNNVTTMDGGGGFAAVHIPTSSVVVSGYTIRNGFAGIYMEGASHCQIDNLVLTSCTRGMLFEYSNYNTVVDSVARGNGEIGIDVSIRYSAHNSFQNIDAHSNGRYGFHVSRGSDYTQIVDCHVHDNGSAGVSIGWSSGWSIEDCLIHSNVYSGISIDTASNGTVENCDIHSNVYGVSFVGLGQQYNTLVASRIHSNTEGISCVNNMRYNTILENQIYENDCGARIYRVAEPAYGNVFYHNDFVDNTVNARDDEDRYVNTWDDGYPSGGNYWSDYAGEDNFSGPNQDQPGSDGIGDTPYQISADDRDLYPLMSTYFDTTPPTTTIALDGTLGLNGWYRSDVTVTLSATDEGSGVASTEYRLNGGSWTTYTEPFVISTEGTTMVEARSTDNAGNVEDPVSETVKIDKTPPTLSAVANPDILWPPNHKMVQITVSLEVTDNLDSEPSVELISVESSEPDDAPGGGDGNTSPDIEISEGGAISVRAERDGRGDGRVYTIMYLATDEAGNETLAETWVYVPHDQG